MAANSILLEKNLETGTSSTKGDLQDAELAQGLGRSVFNGATWTFDFRRQMFTLKPTSEVDVASNPIMETTQAAQALVAREFSGTLSPAAEDGSAYRLIFRDVSREIGRMVSFGGDLFRLEDGTAEVHIDFRHHYPRQDGDFDSYSVRFEQRLTAQP